MQVWELAAEGKNPEITFRSLLEADPDISGRITKEALDEAFNPMAALKHVDFIFNRVGLS
jgi:adenylosuccinate lyase